jgi:hypothetical protein
VRQTKLHRASSKKRVIPKLKDYQEQFKEHLFFERKNGILQVRMHTKGGPFKWSYQAHNALAEGKCFNTLLF